MSTINIQLLVLSSGAIDRVRVRNVGSGGTIDIARVRTVGSGGAIDIARDRSVGSGEMVDAMRSWSELLCSGRELGTLTGCRRIQENIVANDAEASQPWTRLKTRLADASNSEDLPGRVCNMKVERWAIGSSWDTRLGARRRLGSE